ncbi:MAG TPA: MerR family transcriptional regulator [Acidimicrobiales bacterium]|jgi:DNA-binding transcriptional MerR regulator|nr:MerR family transcriptional regulator [Acidimicrobiales bacterium]
MDEADLSPSASRPVYSIGAVARMLGVEAATLRVWEDRYGVIVPARSSGSQRLFSRDQIDHLRFVLRSMGEGSSAADAHRLLSDHLRGPVGGGTGEGGVVILILLAERNRHTAELCEYFLRTEGYEVALASTAAEAAALFGERRPDLSVVEVSMPGGLELCGRLGGEEAPPVLALSPLALQDEAVAAGASAFLPKPLEQLQFVSTVRDLLGSSALARPGRDPLP